MEKSKRVELKFCQTIYANPDKVFPLLCPVNEKLYLHGWNAEIICSESGKAEDNCVFATHPHEKQTIWYTTKYENLETEMISVTPDYLAIRINICLSQENEGETKMSLKYLYTALGPEGEIFIQEKAEKNFHHMMMFWEKAMNHYIKTGECLIHE